MASPSSPRYDDWDDERLGRALASACEARFPATPPLGSAVRARLDSSSQSSRPLWERSRFVALAAVLAALLAGSLAFSPAVREAAADLFGVDGISIEVTEGPPPPKVPQLGEAPPDLGEAVTLESAREGVAFQVEVPGHLGEPDRVFLDTGVPGGLVSLIYKPRAGLPETEETGVGVLVMQFEGDVQEVFLKKVVGPGTSLKFVEVDGQTAYWVSGSPHPLIYLDPEGNLTEAPTRLAGETLLFSRRGVTYRIEGAMTLKKALRIAASL